MQNQLNDATQHAKRRNVELSPEKDENLVGNMKIANLMNVIKGVINESFDEKLKNVATKSDIDGIKNEINAVSNEMEVLKQENVQLKEEVEMLKREKEVDKKNLLWLANQTSNKKLIFKGLKKESNTKNAIRKTCKDILKVDVSISSARKIFEKEGKMSVAVEFETSTEISKIFKNTNKLSGTSIQIERDLMPIKQEKKKAFLQLKKKLLNFSKKYKIMVRDEKLKVEDKWFIWNSENKLVCGKQNGLKVLEDLYGEEVKELDLKYETMFNNFQAKN